MAACEIEELNDPSDPDDPGDPNDPSDPNDPDKRRACEWLMNKFFVAIQLP